MDYSISHEPVRENEKFLGAFRLSPGTMMDYGFRYRENRFDMKDSWVPFYPSDTMHFFDMTPFNADRFSTSIDYAYLA